MNEEDKILYAIESRTCFIKMTGKIRYSLSAGFDALIRSEFEKGELRQFIFDLRETEYIDSTNLGLIAIVSRYLADHSYKKAKIISTNKDINIVLVSMSFDQIFEITDEDMFPPEKYMDTTDFTKDSRQPNEFILDSHKSLLNLNENTKKQFADIVEEFEKRNKPRTTNK